MWCKFAAVAAVMVGGAAAAAPFQPDGPTAVGGFTQLRSYLSPGQHNSTLYTVDAPTATYTRPVLLVDLHGESRYQLGYAYGVLLGKEINDAYSLFITKLIGSSNLARPTSNLHRPPVTSVVLIPQRRICAGQGVGEGSWASAGLAVGLVPLGPAPDALP